MVRVGVRRGDLKRWSGHHAPAYPSPRPPQAVQKRRKTANGGGVRATKNSLARKYGVRDEEGEERERGGG